LKNLLAAARRPRNSIVKIQSLMLFLVGMGFTVLGFRAYPAFIGVGGLFLVIAYRGFTCQAGKIAERE